MLKNLGLVAAALLVTSAAPVLTYDDHPAASSAAAACTKAPTWSALPTKFGVSLSGAPGKSFVDDLGQKESRFGTRIPVVRTWDNPVPSTNVWPDRKQFGSRWVVASISGKPQDVIAGRYDSQIRTFFSNAPTTAPIFWNYLHEPEDEVKAGQFTPAQYVSAFKHVADIAASYCRPNLYPTLVLMGWTANPASHLNWRDYYPGAGYVSVLAWDPYNGATGHATSYRSPATLFDNVVAASKSAAKPFAIAETGSVRIPGDSAGTGRAAWLKQVADYMKTNKAVFVTYYQSQTNGDFELRDAPSVAAWRTAMQSSP